MDDSTTSCWMSSLRPPVRTGSALQDVIGWWSRIGSRRSHRRLHLFDVDERANGPSRQEHRHRRRRHGRLADRRCHRRQTSQPDGLRASASRLSSRPIRPIIGVGEGTWPTLRSTLARIGVSETEFFRNATPPSNRARDSRAGRPAPTDDSYYHPLMLPQSFTQINLAPHWLAEGDGRSFCDAVCPQGRSATTGSHPRPSRPRSSTQSPTTRITWTPAKFAPFLQKHCCEKLGVRHVLADVRHVNLHRDGDIRSLDTEQAGEIEGDLFVDCTGFKALLIGEDARCAVQGLRRRALLRYGARHAGAVCKAKRAPIATHTISTAQSAGWIWDIGLPTRRGIGYVYSSRHISGRCRRARAARVHRPRAARICRVRKIPIQCRPSRNFLEAQLCRGRARRPDSSSRSKHRRSC